MNDAHHFEGRTQKAFFFNYDETREAMVLEVLNAKTMFPLYIKDDAGIYRISRTAAGKLIMGK